MQEIKSLTAMRGIFALWVLGYHLRSLHPVPMPDPFGILLRGYLGVDFFFLLSGFVLAGAYGGRNYKPLNVCRFAVMRVGRMYPLHLAVITVCVIAAWLLGNPHSWQRIVVEGALLQNWPGVKVPLRSINGPSWTISVELLVNLLLAATGWFPLRVNRLFAVVIGLVAYGSIVAIAVQHDGVLDLSMANSATPFYRCLSEFVIGVLLFRWRDTGRHLSGTAISILSAITIGAIMSNINDSIVVALLATLILGISGQYWKYITIYWVLADILFRNDFVFGLSGASTSFVRRQLSCHAHLFECCTGLGSLCCRHRTDHDRRFEFDI